jgi:hypothetical protein
VKTVPIDLLSPLGNREQATDRARTATGLPATAAHSLVLTLDSVSTAILRTAGLTIADSRTVLAALWQQPARITDLDPVLGPPPVPGYHDRDRNRRFRHGLGERLHVIRRARRMSVQLLEARTLLRVELIRDIEAGTHCPTLYTLIRLADGLQVPLPLLVDEKATPLRILRIMAGVVAA